MNLGDAIRGQRNLITVLALASSVLMGCEMQLSSPTPSGGDTTDSGNDKPVVDPGNGNPVVDPGNGNPVVDPGNGNPVVDPGNGDPVVDPGNGNPVVDPGNGNPVVDPGNGNPVVDPGDEPEAFTWFLPETRTYLDFAADQTFKVYKCSFNSGYVVDDSYSGSKSGSNLLVNFASGESGTYAINSGNFKVRNDLLVSYQAAEKVPSYCNDDMIEIKSVTPTSVNSGNDQQFTVEVEYRLNSVDQAVVEYGFTIAENGNYKAYQSDSTTINNKGNNTVTQTITHTVQDMGSSTPYAIHVNLSKASATTNYTPLATDFERINVR